MHRNTYRIISLLLLVSIATAAQAQNANDTFQQFRQEMLSDYNAFRKSVLDSYADFLATAWKEFQTFKGMPRDDTPKPTVVPDVDNTPAAPPASDPVAEVPQPDQPTKPEPRTEPTPPVVPPTLPVAVMPTTTFSFYGLQLKGPQLQCMQMTEMSPDTASEAWKHYNQSDTKQAAQTLKSIAQTLGLNDWLTYELTRECVNSQCAQSGEAACASLQHFLLANMGYNVRLAHSNGTPCLLLAIDQQVYTRNYLTIDQRKYYIYCADGSDVAIGAPLYTCLIPSDTDLGADIDMCLNGISGINSGNSHHCELSYRTMSLKADVDVTLMEMLRHYPQMDIAEYAKSDVCHALRQNILEQMQPYIEGLSTTDAANLLLKFVQHAFAYATDGEQHGYEKTYFFEENFYYPKNDCEDRAIFYAYLVRNLLGLDVHLVQYPGHECTAVDFGDISVTGTFYSYGGKKYVICDPTYVGASIGQCMPDYRDTKPQVETW